MSFKKILAFIVLILAVILITFVIFFFLNKEPSQATDPTTDPLPLGSNNGSRLTREEIEQGVDTNVTLTGDGSSPSDQTVEAKQEKRLRKLYNEPVSGAITYLKSILVDVEVPNEEDLNAPPNILAQEQTSYETVFVDRKNGHLIIDREYEEAQETLTNTTILQVYRAFLSKNQVVMQFLDQAQENIQTFAGTYRGKRDIVITQTQEETPEEGDEDLSEDSSPSLILQEKTLDGSVLPENIQSLSLSPDETEFIYTLYGGVTEVRRAPLLDPTQYQIVHRSPFRDVFVEWTQPDSFLLHAKSDSRTEGFVERISLSTGRATPIESGLTGLLYTEDEGGENTLIMSGRNDSLIVRNTKDGTSHRTSFSSLPEKCIWSRIEEGILYCGGQNFAPNLPVPEAWYQGNFFYNDGLYRVDLNENQSIRILDTVIEGIPSMDIVPLSLSEDDARIVFMDRQTMTPWVFKIRE